MNPSVASPTSSSLRKPCAFVDRCLGIGNRGMNLHRCMKILKELVDQWSHPDGTTELNHVAADVDIEGQSLTRRLGWCPMQNEWVTPWTGDGNSLTDQNDHVGRNGRLESTSIPLQWGDPQPLLVIPGTPQVGKNFFLDETCPVRGFVSVGPV